MSDEMPDPANQVSAYPCDCPTCQPAKENTMTISDFPPEYRARMIAAYPVIADMTADEAYLADSEERDAAFGRILASRNLRRTHELYLADLTDSVSS